jgi:Asp-tRNA(Asn)/Glu-tRNA(Gln) amidotransferase A subunit family amidase
MSLSPRLDDIGALARSTSDIALAVALAEGEATGEACLARLLSQADAWPRSPDVMLVQSSWDRRVGSASRLELQRAKIALELCGANLGAVTVPPDFAQAPDWLETILCRDIAAHHGGDRDRSGALMSGHMRGLIDRGRAITDSDYQKAVTRSSDLKRYFTALVHGSAVLLAPATDGVAPLLHEGTGSPRVQAPYTLAGLAVLAVPTGRADGMPIGVQLATTAGCEGRLFAAASWIESGISRRLAS